MISLSEESRHNSNISENIHCHDVRTRWGREKWNRRQVVSGALMFKTATLCGKLPRTALWDELSLKTQPFQSHRQQKDIWHFLAKTCQTKSKQIQLNWVWNSVEVILVKIFRTIASNATNVINGFMLIEAVDFGEENIKTLSKLMHSGLVQNFRINVKTKFFSKKWLSRQSIYEMKQQLRKKKMNL